MRKGFTLIELLAVILILGIIALIAIPTITAILEESRQGAAKSSALGYVDEVEKQIMVHQMHANNAQMEDGKYTVAELKDKVMLKGEYPTSGTIKIEKGQVTEIDLVIGNYKITGDPQKGNELNVKKAGEKEPKTCKVTTGDGTNIGDEITCGTESFYVYDTTGDNIKMLAKYNLEVGNSSNSGHPADEETNLQSSRALGYKYKSETYATVIFGEKEKYDSSIVKSYVDTYKEKLLEMKVKVEEARLITVAELNALGCDSSNKTCSQAPSFVKETTYWTGTPYYTPYGNVWYVYSSGSLEYCYTKSGNNEGVRPVIVIPKSSI